MQSQTLGEEIRGFDTPAVVLVIWGLIGTAMIAAFLLILVRCVHRSRVLVGYLPVHTAARAWFVALIPFGAWVEDYGFALLAVTLLLTGVASNVIARTTPRTAGTPVQGILMANIIDDAQPSLRYPRFAR